MANTNLPGWSPGDSITSAQLNEIKKAIQDAELDLNTKDLKAQRVFDNNDRVATQLQVKETVESHTGHGYYRTASEIEGDPDTQVIPQNTRVKLTFTADPTLSNEKLPAANPTPFWDSVGGKIVHDIDFGEAVIRVMFKARSDGKDKQLLITAQIPDGVGGPTIWSQTQRLSKSANTVLELSMTIPVWLDAFTKQNGLEIWVYNDTDTDSDDVVIWDQQVMFQMTGGQLS